MVCSERKVFGKRHRFVESPSEESNQTVVSEDRGSKRTEPSRAATLEQNSVVPDNSLQCDVTDADIRHAWILLSLDCHTSCWPVLRFDAWFQGICFSVQIVLEFTGRVGNGLERPCLRMDPNPRIHRPRKVPGYGRCERSRWKTRKIAIQIEDLERSFLGRSPEPAFPPQGRLLGIPVSEPSSEKRLHRGTRCRGFPLCF